MCEKLYSVGHEKSEVKSTNVDRLSPRCLAEATIGVKHLGSRAEAAIVAWHLNGYELFDFRLLHGRWPCLLRLRLLLSIS